MKFLVDECVGPAVSNWLKEQGYDAISVHDSFPGVDDDTVLDRAVLEARIIITSDKDFGEMIFRNQRQHSGIILLRLLSQRPANKIMVINQLLSNHFNELAQNFIVATETSVRIIKAPVH